MNLILFSFPFFHAEAENSMADDSVKVRFPVVEVKADRILSDRALNYSPISEISSNEIQQVGAVQVPDVLTTAPGVFIRNYGGLGGMKIFP